MKFHGYVLSPCVAFCTIKVKDMWSYTSIPPYLHGVVWCLIKYRYNFTFIMFAS
jgi:hypothetical protein